MSGGSFEYAFHKVENFIDDLNIRIQQLKAEGDSDINIESRERFVAHLRLVAEAMKAIEWVDSGDCSPPHNEEAIDKVIPTDYDRCPT